MSRLAYCWLLPLATLACAGPADIPETPDLSVLVAEYEQPDADLDDTTVSAALQELPPLDELSAGFAASQKPVDDAGAASVPAEQQESSSDINLQGSIKVTVRCPGDLAEPVLDPAVNGTFSLTLAVARNRIRRTIGGRAEGCVLRGTLRNLSARVVLDGDVAIDFGRDIGLGQGWSRSLLIAVRGKVDVGGQSFENLSARISEGRIEHLFVRDDGSMFVASLAPNGISIRDRQGIWLCAEVGTCARE